MDQTIIGRSHGIRVCYTDFEEYEVTYLITAFTKKEQGRKKECSFVTMDE